MDNHEKKIYFVDINNNAVWSADFNGNNMLKHALPYMSRSSFASGIAIYKVSKKYLQTSLVFHLLSSVNVPDAD